LRENPYERDACIIGEVKREPRGIVSPRTASGGTRIVDMTVGKQLPRICQENLF
jgi:hydrogenase expression/formation protein HypE